MEGVPLAENAAQLDRLAALAGTLTEAELSRRTDDGWTVAAILAHLSFWDRWAQCLIHRWRSGQLPPPSMPDWYDDAVNETLLHQWLALPAGVAVSLAVDAARAVDHELARLETPVLAGIVAAGEAHLLHRHRHRGGHLDQIDRLLATARR